MFDKQRCPPPRRDGARWPWSCPGDLCLVCLPSSASSHSAAGYCQALKFPLSSSLPRAVNVQKAGGGVGGGPRGGCAVWLWALLATCLDIREITPPTFNPYRRARRRHIFSTGAWLFICTHENVDFQLYKTLNTARQAAHKAPLLCVGSGL